MARRNSGYRPGFEPWPRFCLCTVIHVYVFLLWRMLVCIDSNYLLVVKITIMANVDYVVYLKADLKLHMSDDTSLIYSRLSLSRSRRDPLKHFEISVLRHIRCAELRKIPNEQPNFTNEHVI